MLVSNMGGVSVIQNDRVTGGYGADDGIVNNDILTLTEGFNHELIFGSDGDGIYIITPEGTKHLGKDDGLQSEIILRVKRCDSHNIYWIITGNSLAYMTPDYQVTTIRNFPYPNNFDLYETKNGDVWILSSSGIYVASAEELLANEEIDPVFYGIQSGLPYVANSNSLSEQAADGSLYIASTEGVVKVNIEKPFINIAELKVALPYAGDGRGLVFLPEIGDEVLVGFMDGNPSEAVVVGALHSSGAASPTAKADDNDIKGITTREGIRLEFDDKKKHVVIETPGGNRITVSDDEGGILVEDQNGNKVTLGSDGIALDSAKDVAVKAKGDVKIEGTNIELSANAQLTAKGSGSTELSSSGNTVVKGSLVQIN